MRVLWLCHRDIRQSNGGGAERTAFEISRRLASRGHELTILSVSPTGMSSLEVLNGVRYLQVGGPLSTHALVPSVLRRTRADIVVDDLAHAVPWGTPLWSRTSGTAFFHHMHARTLPGQVSKLKGTVIGWLEAQYPVIYRRWPFLTQSRDSMRDLISLGVPSEKIALVPPGVDRLVFAPGSPSPAPTLVYFAGMRGYKRPIWAVEALQGLQAAGLDATLDIVGSGPELARVVETAREYRVLRSVRIFGRVSQSRLAKIVSSAWVNLHFSTAEGWALSISEARACGVPTVAFSCPGIGETLLDGETGLVIPPMDKHALVSSVSAMIAENEEWRRRCRLAVKLPDWDDSARMWERHLQTAT